ncbi:hypothetical protein CDL16_17675 [Pseudomonas aeruginosa]|nr:hypothetical protein CDL16_17675 [Pseudomonas aeruginosa]
MADLYEFRVLCYWRCVFLGDLFEVVSMGRYLLLLFLSMVSVCAHSEVFIGELLIRTGSLGTKALRLRVRQIMIITERTMVLVILALRLEISR